MKGTKKFAATLLASLMIVISLFGFAGCELFQEKTKLFFRYKLSEDGEYYIVKGLDYSKDGNPVKEICETHKDRHACIGKGKMGMDALVRIINHPKLRDLPFYLETPNDLDGYRAEIALLRSLRT